MKSIVLMFVGGTLGGMLSPLGALIGAVAGFFAGRYTSDEGVVSGASPDNDLLDDRVK